MIRLLILLFLPTLAFAQLPSQWVGAGVTWNQYAAPQINGLLAYAHQIVGGDHPTYSFSDVTFLSIKRHPFQVMTTTETGIAQHAFNFGPFAVFGLGTVGLASTGTPTGTSVGASFTGGAYAVAALGKSKEFTIGPLVKLIKPTIGDRQWLAGLVVGWGK